MNIHPTAIVDPRAKVHSSCKIGPFCVIGADVELGEGCHLVSHVSIEGPTKIGANRIEATTVVDDRRAGGPRSAPQE